MEKSMDLLLGMKLANQFDFSVTVFPKLHII